MINNKCHFVAFLETFDVFTDLDMVKTAKERRGRVRGAMASQISLPFDLWVTCVLPHLDTVIDAINLFSTTATMRAYLHSGQVKPRDISILYDDYACDFDTDQQCNTMPGCDMPSYVKSVSNRSFRRSLIDDIDLRMFKKLVFVAGLNRSAYNEQKKRGQPPQSVFPCKPVNCIFLQGAILQITDSDTCTNRNLTASDILDMASFFHTIIFRQIHFIRDRGNRKQTLYRQIAMRARRLVFIRCTLTTAFLRQLADDGQCARGSIQLVYSHVYPVGVELQQLCDPDRECEQPVDTSFGNHAKIVVHGTYTHQSFGYRVTLENDATREIDLLGYQPLELGSIPMHNRLQHIGVGDYCGPSALHRYGIAREAYTRQPFFPRVEQHGCSLMVHAAKDPLPPSTNHLHTKLRNLYPLQSLTIYENRSSVNGVDGDAWKYDEDYANRFKPVIHTVLRKFVSSTFGFALHTVNLCMCEKLEDVSMLGTLFRVKIGRCDKLVDLNGLQTVPSVELLDLVNVTTLSPLNNGDIYELVLCHMYSLTQVEDVMVNTPCLCISDCLGLNDLSKLNRNHKLVLIRMNDHVDRMPTCMANCGTIIVMDKCHTFLDFWNRLCHRPRHPMVVYKTRRMWYDLLARE